MKRSILQSKHAQSIIPTSGSQQYFQEMPLEIQMVEENSEAEAKSDGRISVHVYDSEHYSNQIDNFDNGSCCDLCGRSFPNIAGLRTHKRTHKNIFNSNFNEGTVFVKEPAAVTLPTPKPPELIIPELVVDEECSGHTCDTCRRSFPNIFGLRTHQRFYNHKQLQNPQSSSKSLKPNLIRKTRQKTSKQKVERMEIIKLVQDDPEVHRIAIVNNTGSNFGPRILKKETDPLKNNHDEKIYFYPGVTETAVNSKTDNNNEQMGSISKKQIFVYKNIVKQQTS